MLCNLVIVLCIFLYSFFIAHFDTRIHRHSLPFVQERTPFTICSLTGILPAFAKATRAAAHFSGEKKKRERWLVHLSRSGSFSIFARLQVDRAILRGGVAQKRRALVEEAQHLLLAAADVELGLHDLIELLARHAERGVAREAV